MLDKSNIFIIIFLIISTILLIAIIYYNYTYIYECIDFDGNIYYANKWEVYNMKLHLPKGIIVNLKEYKTIRKDEFQNASNEN